MALGVIARVGRFCFRRRWWVLAAWLVAVASGVLASGPLLNSLAETNTVRRVESIQAYDVMSTGDDSSGQVIGLVDRVDPDATAVHDAVNRAADDIYKLS